VEKDPPREYALREREMMQQQMAAYASTTITTELIQKVLSQLFE
jgi:hypothetical protein